MAVNSAPIAALVAWTRTHPAYTYTVDATELAGKDLQRAVFGVTYDPHGPLETVHIVVGKGAGSTVSWRGGDRATVRPPGLLHVVSIGMNVRDGRLLSPRNNDLRSAIFSRVADCVAAHANDVQVERSGAVETLTIHDPAGIRCGNEDGDRRVTTDRITVSAADDRPMMRERYVGDTLVTRWVMRDLKLGS